MERAAEVAKRCVEESIAAKRYLGEHPELLEAVARAIVTSLKSGGKVLAMGNGGSAADAQHIVAELAGGFYDHARPPLAAIALTTNSSVVTAIANDDGYDEVFVRQVRALARPGDVVIGISTSGESRNVLAAIREARALGAVTVGFSGAKGSLQRLVDYAIAVPSPDTPRIQEAHITAGHIICYLVEQAFVAKPVVDMQPEAGRAAV